MILACDTKIKISSKHHQKSMSCAGFSVPSYLLLGKLHRSFWLNIVQIKQIGKCNFFNFLFFNFPSPIEIVRSILLCLAVAGCQGSAPSLRDRSAPAPLLHNPGQGKCPGALCQHKNSPQKGLPRGAFKAALRFSLYGWSGFNLRRIQTLQVRCGFWLRQNRPFLQPPHSPDQPVIPLVLGICRLFGRKA